MTLQIGECAEVLSFTWNSEHVPVVAPAADLVPLPNKPSLDTIQALERELLKRPQVEIEPAHHFADGLYAREITIPAGACVTGKMHRTGHLNFLVRGEITVWTEEGMKRLTAPAVLRSEPGVKRVGFAHTDTTWITVHATDETDVAQIEADIIVPEFPAIEEQNP